MPNNTSTRYQVSPDRLQVAAGQVEQGAIQIKNAVADVVRVIETISADWTGAGYQQFSGLCNKWERAAAEMQKSISGIGSLLQNAAVAYQQVEQEVARLFGGEAPSGQAPASQNAGPGDGGMAGSGASPSGGASRGERPGEQ
ncbi:MAG: WXG100 family type VII secretion target [Acidimicrobiales bacterium]